MAENLAAELAQRQALINSTMNNGKPSFILAVLPSEVNVGGSLSPQGVSYLDKPIMQSRGKKEGFFSKILKETAEDIKKANAEGKIIYDGAPITGAPVSGLDNGGSFVDRVAHSQSASNGIE